MTYHVLLLPNRALEWHNMHHRLGQQIRRLHVLYIQAK
jgi:hypothetical protein